MYKCDIIVPIYNAYDCLEPCINSIIKNTNLNDNRLILIDDKSPDERILPLLEKYENEYDGIILIKNEENLGFPKTVNKGINFSKNDVILLNSDTEVTKDWLDKIKKCAYSSENIATVTPLSNCATFASVPEIYEFNELPENLNLDEMSEIVEKSAYNDIIEVPTGHGFCLFIKRSVIEQIGLFDAETFKKGYGEENDFCFRCLDAGYVNVICDNTFILHKESQSFKNEKEQLIKDAMLKIKEKYPHYKDRLDLWVSQKKIKYIGENIAFNIGSNNKKPNILIVIHDWKDITSNLGGTSLHVYDIIKNLKNEYNFHVLAPEDNTYKLYSYWSGSDIQTVVDFPGVNQYSILPFHNAEYKRMLEKIIDNYNINIIHIHHLIKNFFDVFDVSKEKKIYTIMTLHDFYTVCPRINKLFKNDYYCEDGNTIKCSNCLIDLADDTERRNNLINSWRNSWYRYLKNTDLLITPSEAAKMEINKTFKDLDIKVIEHGVDYNKKESNVNIDNDEVLNVAFVGAIGIHKGSNILQELIADKKNKKIHYHLFGISNIPNLKSSKTFTNHGRYIREELPELLRKNNIKLVCLFSIWPETFSYTLTESIACGIPVLSFNFGAIAERIEKNQIGWLISHKTTTKDIYIKLLDIKKNKKEYKNIVNNINKYKYKMTAEMAKEYKKIYDKNISNKGTIKKENIKILLKESQKNKTIVNYSNYEWVFDTLKWKIISKIKLPKFIKNYKKRVSKND